MAEQFLGKNWKTVLYQFTPKNPRMAEQACWWHLLKNNTWEICHDPTTLEWVHPSHRSWGGQTSQVPGISIRSGAPKTKSQSRWTLLQKLWFMILLIFIYIYITSYNYSIHGVYKPTYNWGVPPCINLCRIARLPNHGLSAWHPRHTELRCPWAVPTTDHHFDDSSQRIYSNI